MTVPQKPAKEAARSSHAGRRVKKLLILYLVFFPFAVLEVFLQKELPVRFALLGLMVPLLVMIALWRWLRRLREIPSRQQIGREELDQERQGR